MNARLETAEQACRTKVATAVLDTLQTSTPDLTFNLGLGTQS